MTEPTMAELLRLDDLFRLDDLLPLDEVGEVSKKQMPELRLRRIYAAYAIKFGWPFCDNGLPVVGYSTEAWKQWAEPEEEYSL